MADVEKQNNMMDTWWYLRSLLVASTLASTIWAWSPLLQADHGYSAVTAFQRRSSTSSFALASSTSDDVEPYIFRGSVDILDKGENHLVISKPPAVFCHHSEWSGSRSTKLKQPEVPMLQRVREAMGERVNLVHRLDRGASGCLLFTLAQSDADGSNATATLQEAMTEANKTYVALVRGEGILKDRNFQEEGWFEVSRPIKDAAGKTNNATTYFRFIGCQGNEGGTIDRPRASLVLARPKTGRWHQIRRHLRGLSHPIIGDSTHGSSSVNREWIKKYDLPPERTCLHLLQLDLPETKYTPGGVHARSPLAPDMMELLEKQLPDVLEQARPILEEEGLVLKSTNAEDSSETVNIEILV